MLRSVKGMLFWERNSFTLPQNSHPHWQDTIIRGHERLPASGRAAAAHHLLPDLRGLPAGAGGQLLQLFERVPPAVRAGRGLRPGSPRKIPCFGAARSRALPAVKTETRRAKLETRQKHHSCHPERSEGSAFLTGSACRLDAQAQRLRGSTKAFIR